MHGLQLEDRRLVVLKARVGAGHLAAVHEVQARLVRRGYPAPAPILGPTPIGRGIAVVDSLLDRGETPDAHGPAGRRLVAAGLARLIALAGPPVALPRWRDELDRLWREPHDARFDFAGTARGAEWIDRLAARAARRLDELPSGPLVIGHGDWRAEHLRVSRDELTATYDYDSLSLGPEPVFAGAAAHAFTADWSTDPPAELPSFEESMAFLDSYQVARGRPFSGGELKTAHAALVSMWAYTARCVHSDAPGAGFEPLARHGDDLLA